MTVQTEVIGEQLITIIDFRGRVLKTWRSSFGIDPNDVDAARRWHQQIEAEVRGTLARVTRREPDRGATVGACLFVEAMRSYAARDYVQAELLLGACEARLPGDARIAAARTRIRSRSAG